MVGILKDWAAPNAASRALAINAGPELKVVGERPTGSCPVSGLLCFRVVYGPEVAVVVVDREHHILMVCATRLSMGLAEFLKGAQFLRPASRSETLEGILKCGYVMATYGLAQWLAREAKVAIELRGSVLELLGGKAELLKGGEG